MSDRSARARFIIGNAFRNPSLRRVEFSYGLFVGSEWAVWISFMVYAYVRGGPSGATAIALVQVVPCAILAPFLGALGDRYRPGRVLLAGYLVQAGSMGAAAASIALGAPRWTVFSIAPVVCLSVTVTRPAQAALLPSLVHTPDELTASNVLTGWSEYGSRLLAPALAGLLLAARGPAFAITGTGIMSLAAALLIARVPGHAAAQPSGKGRGELHAKFSVIAHDPVMRVLLSIQGCYQVLIGAVDFLVVILALSVLHLGQGGAGYLNAALGGGGLLVGTVTVFLIGRSRLTGALVVAFLGACSALAVAGFTTTALMAFITLGAVGFCGGFFDVTARTLLQRAAPSESLASSFAVLESLMNVGLAVGVVIVRIAVGIGGNRGAFWMPAVAIVIAIVVLWRPLFAIDRATPVPHVEIGLLRAIPIFASLRGPALEGVARQLVSIPVRAGTVVIREGDPGDLYYVIADGIVAVSKQGHHVAYLDRGQGFGEIALVQDVPRTASVTAVSDALLYTLDRDSFALMLTGHPATLDAARTTVTGRVHSLETLRAAEQNPPGPVSEFEV